MFTEGVSWTRSVGVTVASFKFYYVIQRDKYSR